MLTKCLSIDRCLPWGRKETAAISRHWLNFLSSERRPDPLISSTENSLLIRISSPFWAEYSAWVSQFLVLYSGYSPFRSWLPIDATNQTPHGNKLAVSPRSVSKIYRLNLMVAFSHMKERLEAFFVFLSITITFDILCDLACQLSIEFKKSLRISLGSTPLRAALRPEPYECARELWDCLSSFEISLFRFLFVKIAWEIYLCNPLPFLQKAPR